ncbi:tRNA 2-thiouridine(34) synthase MnmA [Candidatus Palauibacter sp.]|uniref:tRNA 2-thiouridine(34) synthase MnmA n=1 Tax=Candidatus Palauibacter sp. TaxID=3101350 RepID=UPI003AF1E806
MIALSRLGRFQDSVLVAMSGGVDSSLTAALLTREGRPVIGVTMKTFCYSGVEGPSRTCCGLDGIADAKSVAAQLDMPHHVFDVEEDFTRDVIDDFVSEYAAGRTPIPCVRCNSFTKFRDLLRRADGLGCRWLATGHYARVVGPGAGRPELHRGADDRKDQTYFLWGMPRRALDRLLLPVGDLTKPQVRAEARRLGLDTADKPESFEICFVPDNDYAGVLRRYLPDDHPALSPGAIRLEDGSEAGRHPGYAHYTVGQRKGLPGGFAEPMFVLEIRPSSRDVVIGPRMSLARSRVVAGGVNWLADRPAGGERIGVRIRHGAPIVDADVLEATSTGFSLDLPTPQAAITPGQSAVLYRSDLVLGGGIIVSAGGPPASRVPGRS